MSPAMRKLFRPKRMVWVEARIQGRTVYYPFHLVKLKAELLEATGCWKEAEDVYKRQVSWAEESGLKQFIAESLYALGWIHHIKNDDDRAQVLASQALSMSLQIGDSRGQANAHSLLGGTYYQKGEYQSALKHYGLAQELFRSLGDTQGEAKAYNNIGNILGEQGDNLGAMDLYLKALKVSQSADNLYMEAVICGNMGAGYLTLGDFKLAREWFSKQFDLARRMGNKHLLSMAYGSLAATLVKLGQLERALDHLSRRVEIAEEIGDIKGQAIAWDLRGNIHYTRGEYALAEQAFSKAVELGRRAGLKYHYSGFLYNLACLLLDSGRIEEAEATNSEAVSVADEIGAREISIDCQILAARIVSQRDRTRAVAALRDLLSDSIEREQEADIHRHIYELTREEDSRRAALNIYRKLYEENPTIEYGQKIAHLEREVP